MRIDHQQCHLPVQELFKYHSCCIGFSRTGLCQNAAVLLHQGIGIHLHPDIVAFQHAYVHVAFR